MYLLTFVHILYENLQRFGGYLGRQHNIQHAAHARYRALALEQVAQVHAARAQDELVRRYLGPIQGAQHHIREPFRSQQSRHGTVQVGTVRVPF